MMDNSKPVVPFFATVDGIRSRFIKVEHMNIGEGWMCLEIDGKFPAFRSLLSGGRTYQTSEMVDIVEIDPNDEAAILPPDFADWRDCSGEAVLKSAHDDVDIFDPKFSGAKLRIQT